MSRLLDLMSAGSLRAGDKWYDPTLVQTPDRRLQEKQGHMRRRWHRAPEETAQEPENRGHTTTTEDETHNENQTAYSIFWRGLLRPAGAL